MDDSYQGSLPRNIVDNRGNSRRSNLIEKWSMNKDTVTNEELSNLPNMKM